MQVGDMPNLMLCYEKIAYYLNADNLNWKTDLDKLRDIYIEHLEEYNKVENDLFIQKHIKYTKDMRLQNR
jgi:hypothetical protein